MNAAEVRAEIDRARKLYAKADRIQGGRESASPSVAAMRARRSGWDIVRAVLESHPWRPKVIREHHQEENACSDSH